MAQAKNTKNIGIRGGQCWNRVTGDDLHEHHKGRNVVNMSRFNAPDFKNACELAGVAVTKRQASKWNNAKGAAYKVFNKIDMNGFVVPVPAVV